MTLSQKCKLGLICHACGESIYENDLHKHHISYSNPVWIVPVHKKCHSEIHHTDKYPDLVPKSSPYGKWW